MKTMAKKFAFAVLPVLTGWALTAKACTGNLHLLIANEWGVTLQDISLCDDSGACVISGASVASGEEDAFDVTVNAGHHYIYTAHIYENNVDFYMDIYPQEQTGFIDDLYPNSYSEWGDFISPTTYTISTTNAPSNGGTTSGGGTKHCGERVTVTATPAAHYTFVDWTVDDDENSGWNADVPTFYYAGPKEVSTNANYTFTVDTNLTLTAHFAPAGCSNTFELTVGDYALDNGQVVDENGQTVWSAQPLPSDGVSETFTAVAGQHYTFTGFRAADPMGAFGPVEFYLEFFPLQTSAVISLSSTPYSESGGDLCP